MCKKSCQALIRPIQANVCSTRTTRTPHSKQELKIAFEKKNLCFFSFICKLFNGSDNEFRILHLLKDLVKEKIVNNIRYSNFVITKLVNEMEKKVFSIQVYGYPNHLYGKGISICTVGQSYTSQVL